MKEQLVSSMILPESKRRVSIGDMIRTPDAGMWQEVEVIKSGKWYRIVEVHPPQLAKVRVEGGRVIYTGLESLTSWLPIGVKWEIVTYEENLKKILE